jgi:hypothetical protein
MWVGGVKGDDGTDEASAAEHSAVVDEGYSLF